MLEVIELGYYYQKKVCFSNLNFKLEKNKKLAILGVNGQGKSTLLRCISGALKPKFGTVIKNENIAFLAQNPNFAFDYEVLDIVLMGGKFSFFNIPTKKDIDFASECLKFLNMQNYQNHKFGTLSGGQKQLVLFAKALYSKNEILLLDEPMSALDIANQDNILTLIKNLDKTIIFTTHSPNHALAIADFSLLLFQDGYIYGKSDEILSAKNLSKLYNIRIENTSLNIDSKTINLAMPIYSCNK